MNFRRLISRNLIPTAIILIGLGLWAIFGMSGNSGWWIAWIPFLIALVMIAAYIMVGPMMQIQGYIESGDMEGAKKLLDKVKYPNLLYKPIRSSYYMLKANMSTMDNDLDKAEAELKKSLEMGMPEKEYEGTAYLQLGSIAYQKGNMKEAMENLRKAIKIGLPDKDNEATAYLQLSAIYMQRRDFKSAKMYFAKAKACKPKNAQVVGQLNEMSKYMARIPG